MHLQRNSADAVLPRKFGSPLPVGDHFFIPLPIQHLCIFRRPTVGDPVRLGLGRGAARATRKPDNNANVKPLGQENGFLKCLYVVRGVFSIGVYWIAVATQSSHANAASLELFFPCLCFTSVP